MKIFVGRSTLVFCALLPLASFAVTEHAVILVMDGARYTETLGDATHANVPKIASLAAHGTVISNFRTAAVGSIAEDWSETCPGHARMTTGTYQNIANDGTELPTQPSMFQYYRQQTSSPAVSAWVICSKDKLFILANSSASGWNNQYTASLNCGVNGNGSGGYREDNVNHPIVKEKLITDHPALMIINYKGPDAMGHAADWNGYLAAIKEVDGYADDVWNTIQSDSVMKNTTALFIVNDHGRHTSDYTSHGDLCFGCCHIMCVAVGPDIKKGFIDTTTREQIDLAPTIARMMGFSMPTATGKAMTEIIAPATVVLSDKKPASASTINKISVAIDKNRTVLFSQLPSDAIIDIVDLSGASTARLAADPARGIAVWHSLELSGAKGASAFYISRITSRSAGVAKMKAFAF